MNAFRKTVAAIIMVEGVVVTLLPYLSFDYAYAVAVSLYGVALIVVGNMLWRNRIR